MANQRGKESSLSRLHWGTETNKGGNACRVPCSGDDFVFVRLPWIFNIFRHLSAVKATLALDSSAAAMQPQRPSSINAAP